MSTLVMDNLSMIVANIQDEIKLHYTYKISYDKSMSCKTECAQHLFGSHGYSFEKLPRLLLPIKESNPRTVSDWMHKENLDDNTLVLLV
jgi:hypothetical protein